MSFSGFPKDMLVFLHENKLKNSKAYYSEHRNDYKIKVYEPLTLFIEEMASTLRKIDNEICLIPRSCISRIYRDTRFSKDKTSIYRDNVWVTFKCSSRNWVEAPCFYFEVLQSSFRYGMGFYSASPHTMSMYRNFISENTAEFRKAVNKLKILYSETEHYKKKYQNQSLNDLKDWYSCKNVHITKEITDMSSLYDGTFVSDVKKAYKESADLYNILKSLLLYPKEDIIDNSIPVNNIKFEW